jgi:hypothetical protein
LGAKKQEGEGEMKEFKPGDDVTFIYCGVKRGTVVGVNTSNRCENTLLNIREKETGTLFSVFTDEVFHGHNVTIEIKGEELPERLQVEWVEVPSSNPIHCVIGLGNSVDVCLVSVEMPKHIARQYREWRDSHV